MRPSEHLEHDVKLPRSSKMRSYKRVTKDLLDLHKKDSARRQQEQQQREEQYQSNFGKLLTFATTTYVEALEFAKRLGYAEAVFTPEQRKEYAEHFKENGNGNGALAFKPTGDEDAASEADTEKKETKGN